MWRLMLGAWRDLLPEEREQALAEARRSGRMASRSDGRRAACESGDPWRPPRPGDYVWQATSGAPDLWAADWRRRRPARLAADLRVCAFAEAWERERRAALGLPLPPTDPRSLAHAVRAARAATARAVATYRERKRAVAEGHGFEPGHPARIALGQARVALYEAREEFWLRVMLARAAGLSLSLDDAEEEEVA